MSMYIIGKKKKDRPPPQSGLGYCSLVPIVIDGNQPNISDKTKRKNQLKQLFIVHYKAAISPENIHLEEPTTHSLPGC